MLLTIILPAYNANNTLENAVASIIESSAQDFEVIIVDDCSPESAEGIIEAYEDPRLVYMRNDINLGPGLSRNRGLAHARGKFITFIDADDWYVRHGLDKLLFYLRHDDADLFVFDFHIIRPHGEKEISWQPSGQGILLDFLKDKLISVVWNKVYKKEIIDRHNIEFPHYLAEDSVFNCEYFIHTNKTRKIDESLYSFDKRHRSTTHSQFDMQHALPLLQSNEAIKTILEKLSFEGISCNHINKAFARRRFIFGFRVPLFRFYEDWRHSRIDTYTLSRFKKRPPVSPGFILGGFLTGNLSILEAGIYGTFRVSPTLTFWVMKRLGM